MFIPAMLVIAVTLKAEGEIKLRYDIPGKQIFHPFILCIIGL